MGKPKKTAGTTRVAEQPFGFPRRPKFPTPSTESLFKRGPTELRSAVGKPLVVSGPGLPPTNLVAMKITLPEWYVYWALERLGKSEARGDFIYRGNLDVEFQASLRAQLDFTMLDGSMISFEVQGTHWHYEIGPEKVAEDQLRRALVQSAGYTVIFLDEDQLVRDETGEMAKYLVREGLAGRDHSFQTLPYVFTR